MQLYQFAMILAGIALLLGYVIVRVLRSVRTSGGGSDTGERPRRDMMRKSFGKARTPANTETTEEKTERRRKLVPASQLAAEADTAGKQEILERPVPAGSPSGSTSEEDAAEQSGFSTEIVARLEDAFERYQAGAIPLESYRALVLAQQVIVDVRKDALRTAASENDSEAWADAEAAREAADWCLQWADDILLENARTGTGG